MTKPYAKFKDGDVVRVTHASLTDSPQYHVKDEFFTVKRVMYAPKIRTGAQWFYLGDADGIGVWEDNLELLHSKEPEAQPELLDWESADKGARIKTSHHTNSWLEVSANFGSEEKYRDAPTGNIVVTSKREYQDSTTLGLSLDEAKELAVALFNQILYLENLRK